MVVTKLDVLDTMAEIPVCVGYKIGSKNYSDKIPAATSGFEKLECVYEKVPGWKKSTEGIREVATLPAKAQDYIKYLEEKTGARVGMISTGPDRDQTIMIDEFASELGVRESSATRA